MRKAQFPSNFKKLEMKLPAFRCVESLLIRVIVDTLTKTNSANRWFPIFSNIWGLKTEATPLLLRLVRTIAPEVILAVKEQPTFDHLFNFSL
uniref:Uncharacterized protein n=1 Tax=Nelumbo nucifera TaxID=4432 RepID=A0A822ZF62_NELNU|nr:TPA_asm: hypothetical protein HUJ06_001390 [Nelumbo nucifera]